MPRQCRWLLLWRKWEATVCHQQQIYTLVRFRTSGMSGYIWQKSHISDAFYLYIHYCNLILFIQFKVIVVMLGNVAVVVCNRSAMIKLSLTCPGPRLGTLFSWWSSLWTQTCSTMQCGWRSPSARFYLVECTSWRPSTMSSSSSLPTNQSIDWLCPIPPACTAVWVVETLIDAMFLV